jgi:hypothetical protein
MNLFSYPDVKVTTALAKADTRKISFRGHFNSLQIIEGVPLSQTVPFNARPYEPL